MKKLALPSQGIDKQEEKFFDSLLEEIFTTKSRSWNKVQEFYMLHVYKETLRTIPAYSTFLSKSGFFNVVSSSVEFKKVPSVSKKNYLRRYPWKQLCKQSVLAKESLVMTSTSGSTGEPFFFPRVTALDIQSSVCHQMFLRSARIPKKSSTLVIDCFGMGVWIGGLITYQAFKYISERGYTLSLITPGINKKEVFQTLRNLGDKYENIILCGYPPFIKDVIDSGCEFGVDWKKFALKIVFAAESFSETFRDYIVREAAIKDPYRDTMNIYGSADLGTMAQETPLSILLRRLALGNEKLYFELFGQATRLPTLAQYIPWFINFEAENNSLYCTGDNALPLVRYEIGDNGGVFSYDEMVAMCARAGVDLAKEVSRAAIADTVAQLPFVYVYERSDFSASFYGALIYPEYIKKALADSALYVSITGKFAMYTKNDAKENQYLEINIEMKPDQKISPSLRAYIKKRIHATLVDQSAEYRKISESLDSPTYLKLMFWPYGHETHFFSGAKQKWVKKEH
jgi:phenylacetate-CoA ligase